MQESYELETIEQLRAIADILRVRIIDLLQEHPMTVTQLGDTLDMTPAKVHYHVRELEKVGLLRLVETREKGGILEKYYQPIAKDISVSKNLFLTAPPDESLAATSAWLDQMKDGFQRAFRIALEQKDEQPDLGLGFSHIYVTSEERKELFKQIAELLKKYENRRALDGEKAMVVAILSYPQATSSSEQAHSAVVSDPTKNNWVVGVAHFNRSDLEKTLAEGKRVDIHVTGICQFANDVSPDLAERAIEHIHLIGKLEATPAVREVLIKKRS
ncbi:MAG: helix-turn-helix domain-containing protein [Chloroflexota bacterium]|nr:helix-turn-helix domain-containing protein [Chloroflexota bacterium]